MKMLRLIFSINPLATVVLFGFIVLVALFAFLLPIIFSALIEQILPQQAHTQFYILIGMSLILVGIRFLLNAIQDYLFILLRTAIERKISLQYFTSVIFNVSAQQTLQIGKANLASRLMLWLSNFQYFLSEFIYFCGYALVVSALVFGILFFIEPQFAILALLFLLLHWLNYQFSYPLITRLSASYNHTKHQLSQFSQSTFSARKVINVYQSQSVLSGVLYQSLNVLHGGLNGREQVSAWQEYIQNGLRGLQFIAFVYLGILAVTEQRITLGEMLFCLLLISLAYQPVYRLSKVTRLLGEASTQLEQLQAVSLSENAEAEIQTLESVNRVTLNNIQLSRNEQTLLDGIHCQFEKGKVYLIEGESGTGKSSLLQVIAGVTSPNGGDVFWECDPQNISPVQRLSQSNKAEKLSWMTQHSGFLAGTLLQNLTTFSESVDCSRLRQALLDAKCDFLNLPEHPEELEQALGVEIPAFAAPFSGGEAQRLNLARTLYQQGDIRLFDEPTANLDANSEAAILSALVSGKSDCITIIVSHRPAVRAIADQIFTLAEGDLISKQGGKE